MIYSILLLCTWLKTSWFVWQQDCIAWLTSSLREWRHSVLEEAGLSYWVVVQTDPNYYKCNNKKAYIQAFTNTLMQLHLLVVLQWQLKWKEQRVCPFGYRYRCSWSWFSGLSLILLSLLPDYIINAFSFGKISKCLYTLLTISIHINILLLYIFYYLFICWFACLFQKYLKKLF